MSTPANPHGSTVDAIDARLAELEDERRERQRGRLLRKLFGRWTPLLRDEVVALAAGDLERDDNTEYLAIRYFLAVVVAGCGFDDIAGLRVAQANGRTLILGNSASAGQVAIGTWDVDAIAKIEETLLQALRRQATSAPGSRGGRTREHLVAKVAELWTIGSDPPSQEMAAAALLIADPRTLRKLQGKRRWRGVLEDADRLRRTGRA